MARQAKPAASNIARRRAAAGHDGRDPCVERRQTIVRAAADVFTQQGFRGTTLAHVAESVGVDRASLCCYVASKDELFREIATEAVRRNLATAVAVRVEWSRPRRASWPRR